MSVSESIVSQLVAKLVLDTSAFTAATSETSGKLEKWANGLRKIGEVSSTAATAAPKSAMNFETAFIHRGNENR